MGRFLCFINEARDIGEFHQDFPEHEFFFVSQLPLPGANAVVRPETVGQLLEEVGRQHAAKAFSGMVFGSGVEMYVKIADQCARALGLRRFVTDPEAVRDKHAMRLALAGRVACPESRVVTAEQAAADLPDLRFPCVLKPRHGFGSICVFKATNRSELTAAQRGMQAALDFLVRRHPLVIPSTDMLLESFVGGTEHTAELFLVDGQPVLELVSDKLPMQAPYFIESGDVMPSRLAADAVERIMAAARAAAAAVGVVWGWAHVEIKLDGGVAHVIEIAGRPGGGYTRAMVRMAYGLDPRRVLIEAQTGLLPIHPDSEASTVFGRNVVCEGIELVVALPGLAEAERCDGFHVVRNRFQGTPRIFLGPPLSFDSTILSYFVCDPVQETAVGKFRKVDSALRVRRLRIPIKSPATLAALFAAIAFFRPRR